MATEEPVQPMEAGAEAAEAGTEAGAAPGEPQAEAQASEESAVHDFLSAPRRSQNVVCRMLCRARTLVL